MVQVPYFKGKVVGKRFANGSQGDVLVDIDLTELHGKPLEYGYLSMYAIATKTPQTYKIGDVVSVSITIEEPNEPPVDN